MKKVRMVLLLLLAVILCPKISKAQMATTMGTYRTEREIPNTETFNAIKSMETREGYIVSLAHEVDTPNYRPYYVITAGMDIYPDFKPVNASYFIITMENTNHVEMTYLSNVTITDFDYDEREDYIYFCGVYQNVNTGNNINVIGWIDVQRLLDPLTLQITLYPVGIPTATPTSFLKKIDFYRTYQTEEKRLSLIANDNDNTSITQGNGFVNPIYPASQFISYDLNTNSYVTFPIDNIRLTDVIHTASRVAVVGIKDKEHLVLFSHNQENINDYKGRIFETYELYDYAEDVKYSIVPLDADQIVVGSSLIADEGHGRLEFTLVDMTEIDVMHTQALVYNVYIECRSKIADMEFDKETKILHVLACNGCNYINIKDMILQVKPYSIATYPSYVVVPKQTVTGYDLMKDLTLYDKNQYYLVFGTTANQQVMHYNLKGNLYFFDKIAYLYPFNDSPCEKNYYFDMEVVPSKYFYSEIFYNAPLPYQNVGFIYPLQHMPNIYNVICK